MVTQADLRQVDENVWEIPRSFRSDMRVPARLYADDSLIKQALTDKSVEQLINTTTLPGILKYAIAMPDIHQGYGFPIGGVVATRVPDGAISPGGVGYDINCGVRLLASSLTADELNPFLADLASALYRNCPSGTGAHGELKLTVDQLDNVLSEGSRWCLKEGYTQRNDLAHTEECGTVPWAEPAFVSERAKERGRGQLGTLGAGNHFLEIDRVVEIFDEAAAGSMGLFPEQVVVQVHCGSRGLGHQVCQDHVSGLQQTIREHGIELPDRELACAPFDSPEGQAYFRAMNCAANFAFANRQVLAHRIRTSFERVLAGKVGKCELRQIYDIAHNMAKIEEHDVGKNKCQVCVHRKGATRAFGPTSSGLPPDLVDIGQPVLIPGSMGTESYVLVGTIGSMKQTFGSTCHGAGRLMSRAKAKKSIRGEQLRSQLESHGVVVRAGSMRDFAEETPDAYKDVSQVVNVVARAGIAKLVARLEPMAVIKG
jgi:tRNA-splicing ligase RtcB